MATDTDAVAGVLKQVYDSYVEKMQNLRHRTIDEVGKSMKKYDARGQGFYGAINDYGNESGGAQTENEAFRPIDSEHYEQWRVKPKIITWPIEFSGLSAAVADEGDEEAFAEVVVDALDMAKERLLSDENRQFFGKGTGDLASPSTAVVSDATSFAVDSTQYLRRNMVVDIYNGSTKTVDSKRIIKVDHQNKVIHFATSIDAELVTTDVIVKENIRDSAPADGKEMMGLRGIIDDGTDLATFQNLNVADIEEWQSTRIDASGANLTSDLHQRLEDDVEILGGESIDLYITHAKQRRKYLNLVVPQRRYQDGKMDAGFTELTFNGKRMLLDKDCQSNVIYGVVKKHLRKFEVKPLMIGGYGGSDKFQRVTNYDKFQSYWVHYCNYGTSKRTGLGKIVNLAVPSGGLS